MAHFDAMLVAIVDQGDYSIGQFCSVEECLTEARQAMGQSGDGDMIRRLPVAILYFARSPAVRQAGR